MLFRSIITFKSIPKDYNQIGDLILQNIKGDGLVNFNSSVFSFFIGVFLHFIFVLINKLDFIASINISISSFLGDLWLFLLFFSNSTKKEKIFNFIIILIILKIIIISFSNIYWLIGNSILYLVLGTYLLFSVIT